MGITYLGFVTFGEDWKPHMRTGDRQQCEMYVLIGARTWETLHFPIEVVKWIGDDGWLAVARSPFNFRMAGVVNVNDLEVFTEITGGMKWPD